MTGIIKHTGWTFDTHEPCFDYRGEEGNATGCYSDKAKKPYVLIHSIVSHQKGGMKIMLDAITEHFKTNRLEFTNVIGPELVAKLKGFKWHKVYWKEVGEYIDNLRGIWKHEK